MHKRLGAIISIVSLLVGIFAFSHPVKSDSAVFSPISGTDATANAPASLTSADLNHLKASDDQRMASNAAWPASGSYDETRYLEFVFNPNIPADATITNVSVTNEYRLSSGTKLVAAKLEVWNGSVFQDMPITMATGPTDISETKDITQFVASSAVANNLKIRFLSYRNPPLATTAKTSHDLIQLNITYALAATTTPSDTPLLTDSGISDASGSLEFTPTPEEIVSTPIPTPEPTEIEEPEPTFEPIDEPEDTPIDTPDIIASDSFELTPSPTASPSFTPVPEATPSASFEIPTTSLFAAIVTPPPRIYHRPKSTPTPEVLLLSGPSPFEHSPWYQSEVMNIRERLTAYLSVIRR